ncbi:MAG: hypothetical protein AB9M60_03170 [Leptothrix sp. (in: b-proteobacteria)]
MGHPFKKLLLACAQLWAWLRDLLFVLRPCRFSVLVLLFGAVLLMAVPQGRELTVRLEDDSGWLRMWFCLAVTLWAFESWYWARFILDACFGTTRDTAARRAVRSARTTWLVNHVPRVIAVLAFALAVVACWRTGTPNNRWLALLLLGLGVAFYALLIWRREIARRLIERHGGERHSLLAAGPGTGFGAMSGLSKAVFWSSFGASAAFTAWAAVNPVGMGRHLGSSAVAFFGFALIVPVGSVLVYLGRGGGTARLAEGDERGADPHIGYPVVALVFALPLLFSLWVDNHAVRVLAHAPRHPVTVASAADAWYAQASAASSASPGAGNRTQPTPLVVVATAGGGIRAAYWTATVLGALQDRVPGFDRQLLGISGVSGGSLGATTYATLLSLRNQQRLPLASVCATDADPALAGWPRGRFECLGQAVLSHDFLAPAVSALLFSDLMQQFIPWSLMPDRAAALEQGWEQAWGAIGIDPAVWRDGDFDQLWARDGASQSGHLPALLLNGTHVESGRRILTSHLAIDRDTFHDSDDFFAMMDVQNPAGTRIRPSTAAHNSARFTYVSPAGRLNADSRIVDGGYHENFGAKTASELLAAALRHLDRQGEGPIDPIAVLISNDVGLDLGALPSTLPASDAGSTTRAAKPGANFASELLSPLRAMLATRDAHGALATHDFNAAAGGRGHLFHFRLCGDQTQAPVLGWVLARAAEQRMQAQLRSDECGNGAEFERLVARLAATQRP